jgi:hypothetical protein
MLKRLILVPAVLTWGLVAVAPAGAAAPSAAHMSGGDPLPPLPSLVQTRLDRVDRALDRLTDYVSDGDAVNTTRTGKVIRRQLAAGWRGASYYIAHPPAVPAEEARVHSKRRGVRLQDLSSKVRAKIAQDDAGPVVADPVTTAMATFDSFHQVSATMIELTDGARVPVLDAMSRSLFLTLDRRDQAIEDVHQAAPPVPPEDRAIAKAAQDEEASTFDLTMPTLPVFLDDEIQHIDGLKSDAADLRPGGLRILNKARKQIVATKAIVNGYWPPAPPD